MTDKPWRLGRLAAMAEPWVTARERWHAAMQDYLDTYRQQVVSIPPEHLTPDAYKTEIADISSRILDFIRAMDRTVWYTLRSPERLQAYLHQLDTLGEAVVTDAQRAAVLVPPGDDAVAHDAVQRALGLVHYILSEHQKLQDRFDVGVFFFTRHLVSQIKYCLYPVRLQLPAFRRYWLLDNADAEGCEPHAAGVHPGSGIQRRDIDGHRGAYTAYVPETYQPEHAWPLILALHGGSGNDEDFLWAWLKYAKSRGYLLVCAKSFGLTWHPWDESSLLLILDDMQSHYHIDTQRVLLTGLSDGGAFSYEVGFANPQRFAGLAVVAGIMHPTRRDANASRLPVYIAHGEKDHLFPIGFIRTAVRTLQEWGHDVTCHEIANFGHAYPPGENAAILDWFARL